MTGTATPSVAAYQVIKRFHGNEILKGVDMTVQRGEVVCLIGPSGSGKSTFLACINHLEKIDGGALYVDRELMGYRQAGDKLYELNEAEIARRRAGIGMVFQRFNLFGHMTVLENVTEARALGMKQGLWLRRVVLPQAVPFIIPRTGNQVIGMLKTTSLVSVISLSDLLYSAQSIYSRTFESIPLLIVCCIWYLAATTLLSALQSRIEKYFRRSQRDASA